VKRLAVRKDGGDDLRAGMQRGKLTGTAIIADLAGSASAAAATTRGSLPWLVVVVLANPALPGAVHADSFAAHAVLQL